MDNFVRKNVNSDRFGNKWFPLREWNRDELRVMSPFVETIAKTQRYFNSPLSYMRRRANVLYQEQEIELRR